MKKLTRVICLLLVLTSVLCACGEDSTPTTGTTGTSIPTTIPTTTVPPAQDPWEDPDRELPRLRDKFVTDAPETGDLVIASEGAANAAIVYPVGNSKAKSAATDLADYLKKITGADFALLADDQELPESNLILVGPTAKTAALGIEPYTGYPEAEKISVIRKENCLILQGNDDNTYHGTQNAVTYFLEEAGCGWFAEDELWQIVPSRPTLAVKAVDITVSPSLDRREYGNIPSSLTDRWYLGGSEQLSGQRLWIYIPKGEYANHPEWFSLVDGQRYNPASLSISEWQYCYSNEEFAAAYAAKVIDYFDSHPDCVSMTAAVNDGWSDGWCECDECAALGNKADQALTFANRVAAIVCEKYPDRQISTLAYHDTFLPPEKTTAHPNVQVMFCLETTPLDDLMADRQIHSGFNNINKIEYTQSWLDNVTQWIQVADVQHTSIWGWFCIDDPMYKWQYAPWVQGNVASRNLDVFQQLGVDFVFMDGTYPYANMDMKLRWPIYYTFAKCMYFGDMTGEEVLYDACRKLYGAAADEMFLYYRLLADSAQICDSANGINWVPPSLMEVYSENFNLIQTAVANARAKLDQLTPEQAQRVENQLTAWAYVMLAI